jgi:peptide/nickel transport system substrate-binding protein
MPLSALALLTALVILALGSPVPGLAQDGALRLGLPTVPPELDPATALDGSVPLIARQVFDTLVQYAAASSDVEPALAAQWTVSKDGLVWAFRLRDGVSFHDGTPLSAQHVVDSLEREVLPGHPRAPSGESAVARLLRGAPGVVKQIRARDARTVEIALAQPYAPLLTVLAHPAFSVVLARPSGGEGGNRWQGTGPFAVTEMAAGRIVLEARPSHWSRVPRLGRIAFVEVADSAQADAALSARTLDAFFAPGPPSRLEGALWVPSWRIGYLALQTEKAPFDRVKMRRAVAAALDPVQVGLSLGQSATPLQGFLPRGVWGRREGAPLMGGDPERARRLLAEAGAGPGPAATLLVGGSEQRTDETKLAGAIRASLAAAGFGVTIKVQSPETVQSLLRSGEHQMALAETRVEGGDPHFLLYPLSSSEGAVKGSGALNFSFYRNGRLDDLLIRASQLFFRPERERLYLRAQALLAEEVPWIPLYVRLQWATARPEVKGLQLHPSGYPRLDRVWLDSQPPAPPSTPPSR